MRLQIPAFILHALAAMCPNRNDNRHFGFIAVCRDMIVGGQGAAIMVAKLSREIPGFVDGCDCVRFRGVTAEGFRMFRENSQDPGNVVVLDSLTGNAWKYGARAFVEAFEGYHADSGFKRAVTAMHEIDQEVAAPMHGLDGLDTQYIGRAYNAIRRLKDREMCEDDETACLRLQNTPRRSKALWCFAVSPANMSNTHIASVRLIVAPVRLGEPQGSQQ